MLANSKNQRIYDVRFNWCDIPKLTVITAVVVTGAASSFAAEPTKLDFTKVSLKDPAGKAHSLADLQEKSAVLFFLGTECPVANGYLPTMKQFAEKSGTLGVRVVGVHSDPSVDAKAAKLHQEEYSLPFPVLIDADQRLASMVGAERMGQVVMVREGKIRYRGRIDDRYSDTGKRREQASQHDLQDAVDAVMIGKEVATPETKAFGCPLPKLKSNSDNR